MIDVFGRLTANDPAVVGRLKDWVRARLALDDAIPIVVAELRCSDPECPDVETVVAVLDVPGAPRKYRLFKPVAELTTTDLEAVLW